MNTAELVAACSRTSIQHCVWVQVRDALGLTYDVSFELALFELLKNGWFSVSVTSSPEKIHETAEACVRVLRAPGHSPITTRELERARRTLITRHETDSKVMH